jgi:hypothetical protein
LQHNHLILRPKGFRYSLKIFVLPVNNIYTPQINKLLFWIKVTIMVKMKILFLIVVSFLLASCTSADKNQYDTRAVELLDLMSETIGDLSACSYTLHDVTVTADGTELYNQSDVYMRGPDKMYIHRFGSKGERSTWYNGSTLAYYSFDKNTYATIDAPDNIIKTIEHVHDEYGYDFPAADFFYPDFTDDVLAAFDHLLFLGDVTLNGQESTSVVASNDKTTVQIWVDKNSHLPLKLLIDAKDSTTEFYQATFSNFRTNPDLPDLMFEFKPLKFTRSTN